MDILFQTKKLEKTCNTHAKLVQTYGLDQAKVVEARMTQLRAASCLMDLRNLPGRWHPLSGDRAGELSADLRGQKRLIFEVANEPVPLLEDGGLDWTKVTAVRIMEVGADTHGD